MTATTPPAGSPPTETRHLRRDIGRIGLLFTGVGSIIGSGWLFGAMNAAQLAGPAAIFSWLIAGIMIMLIGLSFSELGTMFPVTGGVIRFPHYTWGGFASYSMGWITWIAAAVVPSIEVTGTLQYATKWFKFTTAHDINGETVHTLTAPGIGAAIVLLAIYCLINVMGVKFFAQINNVLVWWKLAVIVVVIVLFLFTAFHAVNFSSHGFFLSATKDNPGGFQSVFTAISTAGITFSFLGFRQGIELAGETSNPKRNVPFAVIGSVAICTVIYIALQIAFIAAVSPGDISKSGGWPGLEFTNDFGPLAAIASAIGLAWLAVVLYIDSVISPGDTGLIYTAVTSRLGYTMAKNGNAPQSVAKLTKGGVPWVSTIITFVISLVMLLPFPSWQQLVGLVTSATVMSFGAGPLAHAALRRSLPDKERPFRLGGGDIIPFLAFFSADMIIYWTGWSTNAKFFLIIVLGFVVMGIFMATKVIDTSKMDWKAGATWIVPWLVGLAVISYLGDLGDGLGVISGIWMGFLVNLIWSAIIFAIAVRMRLPKERVEEIIATTPHDEVEEEVAV
ncbi:MAG TPA: APC family permease [Streptosporangiaceae bacterium]|jgi:amino acid transporter